MIKVLRIINRFNLGGPTYNATFLSAFLSNEFETKLIGGTHEEHEGDSLFIPDQYGVNYELIPDFQRSIDWTQDRKALKKVRELIQTYKPDIVHTHASKAGAIGRLAASREKVPVVVHTFHGHVFHSYFGAAKTQLYKQVERSLAKKTDAIVAISPQQKKELCEIHKIATEEKVHVIPLGFDLDRFHSNRSEKRAKFRSEQQIDDKTVLIGIIGRLTAIKNHNWFFEIIDELVHRTKVPFKVIVVGDGELRKELEESARLINQNADKEVIKFTSWIKNIDEILPGFDIIALSSLNEGTPVSLIEAQAAGVPVISTNVGGVSDVIANNETGFVINNFSLNDYAQGLSNLILDEELRRKMSQNGWNHVKDKYHYTRLCRDMEKLYHELLKKNT